MCILALCRRKTIDKNYRMQVSFCWVVGEGRKRGHSRGRHVLLCLTVVCCLHFIQSGLLAGELGRINSTTINYEGNYRDCVCMYSTESSKLDLDNLRILFILTVSTTVTVSLTACVEMRPFYSNHTPPPPFFFLSGFSFLFSLSVFIFPSRLYFGVLGLFAFMCVVSSPA